MTTETKLQWEFSATDSELIGDNGKAFPTLRAAQEFCEGGEAAAWYLQTGRAN